MWQVREWLREQLDKLESKLTPPLLPLSHDEMEGWADGGGGWSVSGACDAYRRRVQQLRSAEHRHHPRHAWRSCREAESVVTLQTALDANLGKQRALSVEEASLRECLERLERARGRS